MSVSTHYHAVSGYLEANMRGHLPGSDAGGLPAVAITRQTGAGAISIGRILQQQLQDSALNDQPRWQLVESGLVSMVLNELGLPASLASHYPETAPHVLDDTVEELVGDHPSVFSINEKCHELARRLLRSGHVIVIGRCANLIAEDLGNTLRVRLVGSLPRRAKRLVESRQFTEAKALQHARKEDAMRRRYAKEHFNEYDIDNPLRYDLVLNTDELSDQAAAEMIGMAVLAKHPSQTLK